MSCSGLEFSTKGLQSVCPVGIESFDDLMGGGYSLTSVNVIEEDQHQSYSTMVAKAYLSTGIYAEQEILIFVSSINANKCRFINELPSLVKISPLQYGNGVSPRKDIEKMKIAFRYSNIPTRFGDNITAAGGELDEKRLDFSEHISNDLIQKSTIKFYEHSDIIPIMKQKSVDNEKCNKICRIFIDGLGSPDSSIEIDQLPKFMHHFKILMRKLTKSVCLITMVTASDPNHDLIDNDSIRQKIYFTSDSVIRFTKFIENDIGKNPYCHDYVGLVKLIRLPQLNSFAPYNQNLTTIEFGIKLHTTKKFLSIEPLSLPPDFSDNVSRCMNLSGNSSSAKPSTAADIDF